MSRPRRFSKSHRLSGRKAFTRIFDMRCSAANRFLIIYAGPNGLAEARLGLSVSRKIGNAVRRNRVKRWLREAFRLQQAELPAGYDLICVPRPGINADFADYFRAIRTVADRAVQRTRGHPAAEPPS